MPTINRSTANPAGSFKGSILFNSHFSILNYSFRSSSIKNTQQQIISEKAKNINNYYFKESKSVFLINCLKT